MTVLEDMYAAAREGADLTVPQTSLGDALNGAGVRRKRGHHAALRFLAVRTGIDEASIDRALKRARRADQLDARRAKAKVAA